MNDITPQTDLLEVQRLAIESEVHLIEGMPYVALPKDWRLEDLSKLTPTPSRKTGTVELHDADSFVALAKEQGSPGHCRIYLDVDYTQGRLAATAVFNDHGADEPGWRDHRATFSPRWSPEWKRWIDKNSIVMKQEQFAEFLEYNFKEIVGPKEGDKGPAANEVLEFVTHLQETRTVKYGSAVNLMNGMVKLEFTEEGDKGTKGQLEVFKQFHLALSPFENSEKYRVTAFLRYRIDRNTGQIGFWYEMQRPEQVVEDTAKAIVEKLKNGTGFPVLFGKP
jgi:uncharacterized protein YfdQ (DUF2303 family)